MKQQTPHPTPDTNYNYTDFDIKINYFLIFRYYQTCMNNRNRSIDQRTLNGSVESKSCDWVTETTYRYNDCRIIRWKFNNPRQWHVIIMKITFNPDIITCKIQFNLLKTNNIFQGISKEHYQVLKIWRKEKQKLGYGCGSLDRLKKKNICPACVEI